MNLIDVNYILDGQVQLFDYIFFTKVGIDGDKNYIYLVQDKFRDNRYAKFVIVNDLRKIREVMTPLLIYQNSNQSKLIQPIYDFTVAKDKRTILVTMPVPPRTLYSVIKDTKVNLRVRLFLVQNLANGGVYMHNRRRFVFGHIRPESIAIHEQLNVFQRGKSSKKYPSSMSQPVELYARLNSFSTLLQTQTKPQKWKWMNAELQYYDAPQIWSEIDRKRGADIKLHSNQSEKSVEPSKQIKYTQKSDVWALGLVMVEVLTAMRIHELLGSRDIIPGRLLKQLTIKQKLMKNQAKANLPPNFNQNQKGSSYYKKTQQFYDQLLKYIQCFPIRSIIQRMLAYKPDRRPTIEEVLLVVERLQVIDKRNKNLGRITSYRRSLKNLRQTLQERQKPQNKSQEHQNFDDKKSVVSMKSVRSGKSSKSHVSQSRKRIPPDFTAILYARQQISEIHTMPANSLYRTYYEDCKNRLPIDVNFTPPPKKIIMKKDDKAMILSLKGEKEEDIQKWNIQKAMGNNLQSYEQRIIDGITARQGNTTFNQNKNLAIQTDQNKPPRKYQVWLHNLRLQEQQKKAINDKNISFGPVIKKIPHSTSTMKQYGYNDNLSNYHFLGVQYNKQALSLQTCLFRKQIITSTQLPQKFPQFILNLRNRNLLSIPSSVSQYLQPPNCLKYLCLARNQIVSMKPLTISVGICQNLIIIDLSYNHLMQIDIQMWKIKFLEQCYLGYNQIKEIKGFDGQNKQNLDYNQNTCQNEHNMLQEQNNQLKSCQLQNKSQIQLQNIQNKQQMLAINEISSPQAESNANGSNLNNGNKQNQQNVLNQMSNKKIKNPINQQQLIQITNNNRKACLKLKKLYLNSNSIRYIENVFELTCLEVLALGKNPIAESISNIEAFSILQSKNVTIYY